MKVGNKNFNYCTYLSKQSHLVVRIVYITTPTPPDMIHTRGTNHAMFGAYVKKDLCMIVLSGTTVGTDVSGIIMFTSV